MPKTSDTWPSTDGLRIGFLNINHIANKLSDVSDILSSSQKYLHLFGIAETKLPDQISSDDIKIPTYHIIPDDPSQQKEKELLVYIHDTVHYKRIESLENYQVESIWIEIHLERTKPILIGFIYRNPAELTDWYDRFTLMMEDASVHSDEIILFGDFNIDLFKVNQRWTLICDSFHLTQLIDKPTRITDKTKTLIDHIYSTSTNNITEVCRPIFGCSDHFPVCLTWSKKGINIPKNSHKVIRYRCFSGFNKDAFLMDLLNSSMSLVYQFTNPDEAFEIWYHNFLNVYNVHAPFKTKRVKSRLKEPWITKDIEDAIAQRNKLSAIGTREEYKKQRNLVNSMKRSSKKKYFEQLISSKADSKSIWKAINQLINKNAAARSPPLTDLSSDSLNAHFCSIATTTIKSDRSHSNTLDILKDYCHSKNVSSNLVIPLMNIYDVYNALTHLKQTNSRGLDGIDGKILKIAAPVIADSLTYIYNLCISKNTIPKAFKTAKVIPIFKGGDHSDPSNYRPISILSILSKPLEHHINKHILNHFNQYNLFHPNQSGFRANHSCHTALTNLIDQWLTNINNNKITGVIFVDFAKAFDVIDHSLLLRKLQVYGSSDNTLKLMSSFLSERKQVVSNKGDVSTLLPNNFGVPQGSVIGPLLFSIYINDLPLSVNTQCELFADDTTIHTCHSHLNEVTSALQESIHQLLEWSEQNHMNLHPQKTKYLTITTRQKRQNLPASSPAIFINNDLIEEVDHHKMLGLTIDNNLSWMHHISILCKKISKCVYQLSRMKHFLDLNSRKIFFNAYIMSHMNYASTIWDSASANILKPLFSLHRRALKLVLLKPSSLTLSDYKALDILPLKSKLKYNKAVFVFKIMSGFAPPSLQNRFVTNCSHHTRRILVPLPRIDLYKSSLTYSGGCLWNEISKTQLCNTSSQPVFKKSYHKHLMNNIVIS